MAGGNNSEVAITSGSGMTVVWDGRSDTGTIVTNGRYQIEVHYTDGKGSEQTVSRGVIVESTNSPLTNGNVTAGPNILKNGQTITTVRVNSAVNYTLVVRLYDVAGELLRTVEGTKGSNQATVDVKGLSSGLYFVVADLRTPQGGLAGKQTTQIVIQR